MKLLKLFIPIVLLFSVVLISVGYAAVTGTLLVDGVASLLPMEKAGIYITAVETVASTQGIGDAGSTHVAPTNVKSVVSVGRQGSITYKVTIENSTDMTYWFREYVYVRDLSGYQNHLIGASGGISILSKDKLTDSVSNFNEDDWIPPNTTREFYLVYSFGANTVGSTVSTLVNFVFGERVESYADEILAILNNPEKYATISSAFNEAFEANGTTVLGNVGADEGLFDMFFGPELELDGKPVTIMIQRIDVDKKTTGDSYPEGPEGCEYTIYVTTDDPTTGTPTVHAVSYTREANGVWVQIGELYEGTVKVGSYIDSDGKTHTSIDVESWEAVPKTYTVFTYKGRTVTYKVNQRYGNSFQQQKTIEEIMSMQDQELYNQLDKPQILVDIYKILFKEHVGSTAPEILLLHEAYDNAMRFYQMRNNGQEFGLDNKATRAELLSTIEALAKAMDYYTQVHDTGHT